MSDEMGSKKLKLSVPDYITDDIVFEILLHLPIDDLVRYKSVCKSWLAQISSPNFAKSQLAIVTAASNDQIHIAHSYDPQDESDTSILLVDVATRQIVADLHYPFFPDEFPRKSTSRLVGSASGIVCVSCTSNNLSYIYLWNPATKMSKRIPLPNNIRDHDEEVLGFGFDPIGNDFKVVRLVLPTFSAEVYSASTNAWRNVDPNPIDFPTRNIFDVCFNGFLCTSGRNGSMIAFDLNAELFNCVPAPTFDESITDSNDFDYYDRITEYNGSIAAIIWKRGESDDCAIKLWSLDDQACLRGGAIQASWTLMLNIFIDQPVQVVHGYINAGDFLLLNNDVWYMYNPDNEEADMCFFDNERARKFTNAFYSDEIFRYTKSLYKLDGFTEFNWNAQEDESEDDGDDESEDDGDDESEDDINLVIQFFQNIS